MIKHLARKTPAALVFGAIHVFFTFNSAVAGNDSLSGKWISECTPLMKRHSVTSVIEFSDPSLKAVHQLFADKKCEVLNLEIVYLGNYSKDERSFNWTPHNIDMTLLRSEIADLYNLKKLCGLSNWKVNTPTSIAGKFCDPNPNPETDKTYFDSLNLDVDTLSFDYFPEVPRPENVPSPILPAPLLQKANS